MQNKWDEIRDLLEHTVFAPWNMVIAVLLFSLVIVIANEDTTPVREYCVTYKKSGRVDYQAVSENMKKKNDKAMKGIASNFSSCFPKGGQVTIFTTRQKVVVEAGGWPTEKKEQVVELSKTLGSYATDGKQLFTNHSFTAAEIDPAQPNMYEMIWTGFIE